MSGQTGPERVDGWIAGGEVNILSPEARLGEGVLDFDMAGHEFHCHDVCFEGGDAMIGVGSGLDAAALYLVHT